MFKKFAFFIIVLSLSSASPSYAQESDEASPRFLVHLLDYLAKDYGGAVSDGKILSESEYHEQVEFCDSALRTNSLLKETKSHPEIGSKLSELRKLIGSKAPADAVSKLARELQASVIQVSQLEVSPSRWPSLKNGKTLFAQNCVSCHGTGGAGDGPVGEALDPKPANFLDEHIRELSPFQAFNTIRMGVPGTGMQAFHALSDKEVWDLAFLVISLRHQNSNRAEKTLNQTKDLELLKTAAISSDDRLREKYYQKDDKEQAAVISSIRTSSDDSEGGGSSLKLAQSELDEALREYESNHPDSAKNHALKAYLEGIEPIEPRLRASDLALVTALETKMAQVRSAITSNLPLSEVQNAVELAKSSISEAEKLLATKEMSPLLAFLGAFAILLREGFEAVLVIIALLGVIRAANVKRAAAWVHGGWTSALGLGLIAWFFSGWLMGMSGASREMMEGVTSLFAVVILLIVGFWLHSQTEIGRWKAFIHGKVQKALQGKNLWGLASISFIAVFREAFETVLFLRAIWLEGGSDSKLAMSLGVISSLVVVIGLAAAILKYSAKLPIKRLFEASAVIMAALALILTGKGLHSLQETGALSVTSSPMNFRADLFGVYPTWETLISQIIVVGFVMALWAWGSRPSVQVKAVRIEE